VSREFGICEFLGGNPSDTLLLGLVTKTWLELSMDKLYRLEVALICVGITSNYQFDANFYILVKK
jgi:hypothetical protein